MTSIREQILAALTTTTLGSTTGVTAVYRSRAAAIARAEGDSKLDCANDLI